MYWERGYPLDPEAAQAKRASLVARFGQEGVIYDEARDAIYYGELSAENAIDLYGPYIGNRQRDLQAAEYRITRNGGPQSRELPRILDSMGPGDSAEQVVLENNLYNRVDKLDVRNRAAEIARTFPRVDPAVLDSALKALRPNIWIQDFAHQRRIYNPQDIAELQAQLDKLPPEFLPLPTIDSIKSVEDAYDHLSQYGSSFNTKLAHEVYEKITDARNEGTLDGVSWNWLTEAIQARVTGYVPRSLM